MTDTTEKLAAALAKVQAELPKLERDRTVEVQQKSGGKYSYSYVTLANLNDAILPLLSKHGLAFAALPGAGSDGKMSVGYILLHTSGERIEGEFPISGEGGIQMIGGRITYARRYILSALVGVAADEDDETHLASEGTPRTAQRSTRPRQSMDVPQKAATAKRAAAPPLPGEVRPQTEAQKGKMHALFTEHGITDHDARVTFATRALGKPVGSTADLNYDETSTVIDWLNRGPGGKQPNQPSLDEPTDNPGFGDQP